MRASILSDLLSLLPLVLALFFLIPLIRLFRATSLMRAGEYAAARRLWLRALRSWTRRFPGSSASYGYNAAACLIAQGQVEPGLRELRELAATRMSPNLRYAVASAIGGALVLGNQKPVEAESWLEKAIAIHRTRADLLLLAHAKLSLGELEPAKRLALEATEAHDRARVRLGTTVLLRNLRAQGVVIDMLYGWFLLRTGERDYARASLERAAASPFKNLYSDRARELLATIDAAPLPPMDAEPASSLRPHVLSSS